MVLSIHDLVVTYRTHEGTQIAVDHLDLTVERGEVVALVGESGCGKSTLARAVLGMLPANAAVTCGSITVAGTEVVNAPARVLRSLRGGVVGLIPQDPNTALNPLRRIGAQAVETLQLQRRLDGADRDQTAISLLERVGIDRPADRIRQYPGELSGGMKQRVLIASAISTAPQLLVADEPTSALDVTVQRSILDDLEAITGAAGMATLLITHDLAVAADRADRILVMHKGRIVEAGHPSSAPPPTAAPRVRERAASPAPPVIAAEGVTVRYAGFTAVHDATVAVAPAETVGLIGESGSGKSTLARTLLGLVTPDEGRVLFDGAPVDAARRREYRRRVQLVYQNPSSSLDPRFTIRNLLAEPMIGFGLSRGRARETAVRRLLDEVKLPAAYADRRLHELSGGQRQRVAIARTLAADPDVVVLDEAISALDVTLQEQILALLDELQQRHRMGYLFISHNLGVVRHIADRTLVMRAGRIVESGPTQALFDAPQHEYTRALIEAIPGDRRTVRGRPHAGIA